MPLNTMLTLPLSIEGAQVSEGEPSRFFSFSKQIFNNRRLTNFGELVQTLEKKLALHHQVDYCVTFCNACIAIITLLEALKQEFGRNKVIMPPFTYDGLPHLAQWAGLVPLFCDIEETTHTLSPTEVAKAVDNDTLAILGVHQVNSVCKIDELTAIAAGAGIPLIFDSVYGINSTYNQKFTGGFGRAEVFSLHATKLVNGFEGGYITTNDPKLAKRLKSMSSFEFEAKDCVTSLGLNGKLNELHAAMALASLEKINETTLRNKNRYEAYRKWCAPISDIHVMEYAKNEKSNYCFVIAEVGDGWELTRDEIVRILQKENALATPYYSPPLHLSPNMPQGMEPPSLPITEKVAGKFISLPAGDFVNLDDIQQISSLIAFIRNNDKEIATRIRL